jgi:hypothetical protein
LASAVTDILVESGDRRVVLSTVKNAGAKLSDNDFVLVRRSNGGDQLAECVGARLDVPERVFHQLLDAASDAVRAKLKAARPEFKDDIGKLGAQLEAFGKANRFDDLAAALGIMAGVPSAVRRREQIGQRVHFVPGRSRQGRRSVLGDHVEARGAWSGEPLVLGKRCLVRSGRFPELEAPKRDPDSWKLPFGKSQLNDCAR